MLFPSLNDPPRGTQGRLPLQRISGMRGRHFRGVSKLIYEITQVRSVSSRAQLKDNRDSDWGTGAASCG